MSSRIILAALAAAFVFSGPMHLASAQTPATTVEAAKDKTTDRKARSQARKAAAAERKAKIAEKKAKASAERRAAHARQKQCGAEWKKARADGTAEKGMTWPKYYSACNKRLKEKAA